MKTLTHFLCYPFLRPPLWPQTAAFHLLVPISPILCPLLFLFCSLTLQPMYQYSLPSSTRPCAPPKVKQKKVFKELNALSDIHQKVM